MEGIVYDLAAGLDLLVPAAQYTGSLKYSTEQEYGEIVWQDQRTKPSYTEAVEGALDAMRQSIALQIDYNTKYHIENSMSSSLAPATVIESTSIWQFNALNLWINRDNSSLVTYPYQLGVSSNIDGSVNYITLSSPSDIDTLYTETYSHVKGWLDSGRSLKNTLNSLTKQELIDFEDNR